MSLRAAIASLTFGLLVGIGAVAPAQAYENEPAGARAPVVEETIVAPAQAVDSGIVLGEAWSAPRYPVLCQEATVQITCTASNPAKVVPQRCYLWVLYHGEETTVCTTFEEHENALRAAGGTEATVGYGCSLGDMVCMSFEGWGRGMAIGATAMMYAVSSSMRFDTTTMLWAASLNEWSFWSWAVLIVMLGAMVWAVIAAVVSGDRSELVGAVVRAFIAIPAVSLTLWLIGHLLDSMDQLTWYVMHRDGPVELFATLQKVMWAGGSAHYFFAFLIHGLLMLSMLLLMLVFAFRNIVLAALIMVGPIAWMVFPIRGIGPRWVVQYWSAVIVLLLTGPLTIGFLTLIISGLSTVKTIWDPQSWPMLVGLVLVAFAPFAVFGLFSFVGGVAADSVGSGAASRAGRLAASAGRTAISVPSRLHGKPAHTPSLPAAKEAHTSASTQSTVRGATAPAMASSTSPSNAAGRAGGRTGARSSPDPTPSTQGGGSSRPAPSSPSTPHARSAS